VIETVMIFALGFLVASLGAILFLPALNARALRLSRRRVEAMLPLSQREVAAERDHLRAAFAVEQRRLERRVEAAHAARHADLAAIGARTMEIAALSRDVKAREGDISERDRLLAADRATIARIETELGTTRGENATALAALAALEDAHVELLDALEALHERPASSDASQRAALGERLAAAESALSDAREAALAEMGAEDADLRRRIGEVADQITGRQRLPKAESFPARAVGST